MKATTRTLAETSLSEASSHPFRQGRTVQGLGQLQISVRIEPIHELVSLMVKVALYAEFKVLVFGCPDLLPNLPPYLVGKISYVGHHASNRQAFARAFSVQYSPDFHSRSPHIERRPTSLKAMV